MSGGRSYPTPGLRRKANGVFFVRFDGRDHSLGSDEAAARIRYAKKIAEWADWRRDVARAAAAPARGPRLTLAQVAERMLDSYTDEGRPTTAKWFAKQLARWLAVHGEARLLELSTARPDRGVFAPPVVPLLSAYVRDLAGCGRYKPRTINHDIIAVKRLFNYAADTGLCPAVNWRGVRRLPVPSSAPEDLAPPLVAALIARAEKSDARLGPWLRLNYFALLRPSETVAVINAVHAGAEKVPRRDGTERIRRDDVRAYGGHFIALRGRRKLIDARGLFELTVHKTLGKSQRRVVVLSPAALSALDSARPVWSTHDGYSAACRRAKTPGAPHVMRDSAASNLRATGAAAADVDRLLGHAQPGVSGSYIREAWPHLHRLACRLAL